MEGPPIDGWWVVVQSNDGDYAGWFKDQIGNTVIIEIEPNKRHGIDWREVQTLTAYRNKPI